jgi:hypothetical protein
VEGTNANPVNPHYPGLSEIIPEEDQKSGAQERIQKQRAGFGSKELMLVCLRQDLPIYSSVFRSISFLIDILRSSVRFRNHALTYYNPDDFPRHRALLSPLGHAGRSAQKIRLPVRLKLRISGQGHASGKQSSAPLDLEISADLNGSSGACRTVAARI